MAPASNNKKKKSKASASKTIPNGKAHLNGDYPPNSVSHANGKHDGAVESSVEVSNGKHDGMVKPPVEVSNGKHDGVVKPIGNGAEITNVSPVLESEPLMLTTPIKSASSTAHVVDDKLLKEVVALREKLVRQAEHAAELESAKHAQLVELTEKQDALAAALAGKDLLHQQALRNLEKAEEESTQLLVEKKALHAACTKSQAEIIGLQGQTAEISFFKMRTKAVQEHLTGECERLKDEVSLWQSRAAAASEELVQCQEQIKSSEDQLALLKDQLGKASENEAVKAELAEAVARAETAEARAETAEAAKARCDSRIDRLRLEWQGFRCASELLSKEKEDLEAANSKLKLQVREGCEKLAKAEAKLRLVEAEAVAAKEATAKWVVPTVVVCGMSLAAGLSIVLKASFSRTYTR